MRFRWEEKDEKSSNKRVKRAFKELDIKREIDEYRLVYELIQCIILIVLFYHIKLYMCISYGLGGHIYNNWNVMLEWTNVNCVMSLKDMIEWTHGLERYDSMGLSSKMKFFVFST